MKTTTLIGLCALTSVLFTGCKEGCFFGSCDDSSETTTAAATPIDTASIRKTVVLKVTGMSCQGCANALKNKVDTVDGVVTCDVSFEKGQASVALSNPDAEGNVEAAIKKLGYTVSQVPADAPVNPAS
ncbi:MAG: heavy metal-associated domain-containing protein [Planctomycetota bacterium]|nr:heavy metal-associated domain-containing protein [Planctomycetota bacterium]